METADLSIVVTTRDRPGLMRVAVESALAQTCAPQEVVVVDDGSTEPVDLPGDERVRGVRHESSRGSAAARNTGLESARGRWVTFLDDDDRLKPHMVEVSLDALARTTLRPPVGVLSGLEIVDGGGRVLETKRPPTCPRGTAFGLESIPGFPPGPAYETKQTLVIERHVLRGVGGWNHGLEPRETTELFLRLSLICSLIGLPVVTYEQLRHAGPRLTGDPARRDASLRGLVQRHQATFDAHPEGYADHLRRHAHHMRAARRYGRALGALALATRLAPRTTLRTTASSARRDAVAAAERRRQRRRLA